MNDWTPARVEERLIEAAAVLRRLPSVRMSGYFSTWPTMIVESAISWDKRPNPCVCHHRRLPPSVAWKRHCRGCAGWGAGVPSSCG